MSATENLNPTIGSEIRRLRSVMGLTLEGFGKLVGIPWQTIAKYESERTMPPADKLLAIMHAARLVEPPFRVARVAKAAAREVGSPVRAAA